MNRTTVSRRSLLFAGGLAIAPTWEIQSETGQTPNWTQFQFDAGNTGYGPRTSGPESDVRVGWTSSPYEIDDAPFSSASGVVADGRLYVGGPDGVLRSLTTTSGEVVWEVELSDEQIQRAPAVSDGRIYVGAEDKTLYAVERDSGSIIWEHSLEWTPTDVIVTNDTVYLGDGNGTNVYAVDESGTRTWTVEAEGPTATPAVTDGTAFIGCSSLRAIRTVDGTEKWSFRPNEVDSVYGFEAPTATDGVVYVCGHDNEDGQLHAIRASDGSKLWSHDVGRSLTSPAVDESRVYVVSTDGLYAVDRETGEREWKYEYEYARMSGADPVVAGETLYTGLGDGSRFVAVETETGTNQWVFDIDGFADATPAVFRGSLYFEAKGHIYALTDSSSKAKSSETTAERTGPSSGIEATTGRGESNPDETISTVERTTDTEGNAGVWEYLNKTAIISSIVGTIVGILSYRTAKKDD